MGETGRKDQRQLFCYVYQARALKWMQIEEGILGRQHRHLGVLDEQVLTMDGKEAEDYLAAVHRVHYFHQMVTESKAQSVWAQLERSLISKRASMCDEGEVVGHEIPPPLMGFLCWEIALKLAEEEEGAAVSWPKAWTQGARL